MVAEKTSIAIIYTFRINAIDANPEEQQFQATVERLMKAPYNDGKGFSIKQIVVDAVLRAEGVTPEMFSRPNSGNTNGANTLAQVMGALFTQFENKLMAELRSGKLTVQASDNVHAASSLSPFAQNFAEGLFGRQTQDASDINEE